jgi:hypothetical protein
VRFCVIGGQAVNAYVEPLVSLDLDLVVAVDQIDEVRKLVAVRFQTECFRTASTSAPLAQTFASSFRLTRLRRFCRASLHSGRARNTPSRGLHWRCAARENLGRFSSRTAKH